MTDEQVLGNDRVLAVLAAVRDGRVSRPSGSVTAPFLLAGQPVPMMKMLAREELVWAPISGPPTLAPRGQRLLHLSETGPPPVAGRTADAR